MTFVLPKQGRQCEFEPIKAHSTVVGIICPLAEIGLTVTQNLGKALALEALKNGFCNKSFGKDETLTS